MNPASNGVLLLLVFAACTPARVPDTRDGGAPESSVSAVALSPTSPPLPAPTATTSTPSATTSTPPSASAPVSASAPSAPAPSAPASTAPPAVVACKSVDDCWVSAKRYPAVPIARPKHLKGKSFKPCVDGEVAPTCTSAGACGLLGYDC